MWNKRFRILWIKLHKAGTKQISLAIPIPLLAFHEIMGSLYDLLDILCVFIPNRRIRTSYVPSKYMYSQDYSSKAIDTIPDHNKDGGNPYPSYPITMYSLRELVNLTITLFDSLAEDGPCELIDVTAEGISVSIKIR